MGSSTFLAVAVGCGLGLVVASLWNMSDAVSSANDKSRGSDAMMTTASNKSDEPAAKEFRVPMKGGLFPTIAWIHNVPLVIILDTGANVSGLDYDDAIKLGPDVKFTGKKLDIWLAVGAVQTDEATISEIHVGSIAVKNVRVSVSRHATNLLGSSFFRMLKFDYENGVLTLRQ